MDKSGLARFLSSAEEEVAMLLCVPGFLRFSFSYCGDENNMELHLSYKGFSGIFRPEESLVRNFSWSEKLGFKYEASSMVGGIKVYCIMTATEKEEYLNQPRSQSDSEIEIMAAEITA